MDGPPTLQISWQWCTKESEPRPCPAGAGCCSPQDRSPSESEPHGRSPKKILFLLFFLSGFCGLLYQVIWVRLCFASFGVMTPVLSVVVSVFMLGLFAGSWLAGKAVGPLSTRTGLSAIWFYALAELLIGVGAFAVPRLLRLGESWLLRGGETDSFAYLAWSGVIIGGAILPWCVLMGTTFPLMMGFVRERDRGENAGFSFLYFANVVGAMAGTLATALALVELLGFARTLLVGAGLNALVATGAALLGVKHSPPLARSEESGHDRPPAVSLAGPRPDRDSRLAAILFMTGLTSMAMEVAWTRAFTPVLQTQVYSFAALLFVYLLATWMGSLRYRRQLAAGRVAATPRLLAWLSLCAALPVVMNDPRLLQSGVVRLVGADGLDVLQVCAALLSIVPFCGLLGYLTPKLIDGYSAGRPDAAGFSYALNVLGCILGPLLASYLLLPLLGVKYTLLLLAAPYVLLLALKARLLPRRGEAYAAVALLLLSLVFNKTYEDEVQGYRGKGFLKRDHSATVIAYGSGMGKRLLVNGVGMTNLTTITKVMAHLPLSLVKKPTSALAICFGMGTTFRSLMSWNIRAEAVELVPSVKDAFPFFFANAVESRAGPTEGSWWTTAAASCGEPTRRSTSSRSIRPRPPRRPPRASCSLGRVLRRGEGASQAGRHPPAVDPRHHSADRPGGDALAFGLLPARANVRLPRGLGIPLPRLDAAHRGARGWGPGRSPSPRRPRRPHGVDAGQGPGGVHDLRRGAGEGPAGLRRRRRGADHRRPPLQRVLRLAPRGVRASQAARSGRARFEATAGAALEARSRSALSQRPARKTAVAAMPDRVPPVGAAPILASAPSMRRRPACALASSGPAARSPVGFAPRPAYALRPARRRESSTSPATRPARRVVARIVRYVEAITAACTALARRAAAASGGTLAARTSGLIATSWCTRSTATVPWCTASTTEIPESAPAGHVPSTPGSSPAQQLLMKR